MKISVIGPVFPYRGGIAHFTTLLVKNLVQEGHNVQTISFKKQYPKWLYPGKSDKDFSEGREKVEADYLLKPLSPYTWKKTINKIINFNPDEIIVTWWVTFWSPAFRHIVSRLKKRGFHVSILIHNTIPHEPRPWDQLLARSVLKQADRFIVMTEKEKLRLLNLLPKATQINVVPHPVVQLFKPSEEPRLILKQRLGLPEAPPILLFFGFIRPYKGLKSLIEALAIIAKQGSDAHLLVVGEFWENPEYYSSLIETLGLKNRIHILNKYIPDKFVGDYFNVSDLFVAPYVNGTQSAAVKTALGFGLPVVVTEAIADKLVYSLPHRCKVVPVNDPEAMAKGIIQQLSVPVLKKADIASLTKESWIELVSAICTINTNQKVNQTENKSGD